jgi:proline dehydrogenase
VGLGRSFFLALAESAFLHDHVTKWGFVRRATKRFMPGEEAADAIAAGAALAKRGRGAIYTRLGEAIAHPDEAAAVRDHYVWLFAELRARGMQNQQVSVKPTQLGLDISQEQCARYLDELAAKAQATGSFLWIDMEDSKYVDRTLALYRSLKPRFPSTGIAMQAYLRRTPKDLQEVMPLKPVVRLVKGAYAEPPEVAYRRKADTDRAYFDLASILLAAARDGNCLPILGTHDVPLLERLVARAREIGLPDGKFEIHMLYGIKDAEQQRLCDAGHTVKTLISYGTAWFKWYMRRLAERPANVWFVIRSMSG